MMRFDILRPGGAITRPLLGLLLGLVVLLAGCDVPLEAVELKVHHRVFVGFQETHRVAPGETFIIGDTEYSARITGFVPDFLYDQEKKQVISASNELRNPAVRLEVYQNGTKVEELWAFAGDGPPHFGRESMLAFSILELIWKPGQEPPRPAGADSLGRPAADSLDAPAADSTAIESTDPADSTGKQ